MLRPAGSHGGDRNVIHEFYAIIWEHYLANVTAARKPRTGNPAISGLTANRQRNPHMRFCAIAVFDPLLSLHT